MFRTIAVAVLLLALGLSGWWIQAGRWQKPGFTTNASPQRLQADVAALTSIHPARSYRNPASLNQAAEYIRSEFARLPGRVTEQPFRAGGQQYRNIILSYGPADAERLIIGAHYDVCGNQPGADDNASGIAGLLETARQLRGQAAHLTRRIDLVAYCLEEPPFFGTPDMGSAVHARSMHDQKVQVRAMLSYEMIGYFRTTVGSQHFPDPQLPHHYPATADFIMIVGRLGEEKLARQVQRLMQGGPLNVQRISLPDTSVLAGLSDHRSYWRYGYPALLITDTSFLRNPNYHRPTDTIETLDFGWMAAVVDGVVAALLKLE